MTKRDTPIILIVEDYPDTRHLLSALLRSKGYMVVEAGDGKEGMLQANRVNPDLILMDLALPELDGVEATRQLRQRHMLSQTPIFAISAFATSDVKRDALAAGCTEVFPKPLEIGPFLGRVRNALNAIRPLALGHGLRAQWSTPICSRDGSVLGTFAIFQHHPARPSQIQLDLIAQVTHIASIAIERGLADEALRSSERNLSLTINTIPTLIQVSRPDGTILSVNQAVLDYYGVTLQDMQKEDFRVRVYHPDDVERLREERMEALKRPLQFEYEQRALGKDGKYRWFLVRYNPLLDDQGTIDRWYATAFDIEDRKRAQEDVRRSEAFLAEAQRLTSIGSFSWLVATDELAWSEELYRIYEFDPGIKITLGVIRTRVHPEDLTL